MSYGRSELFASVQDIVVLCVEFGMIFQKYCPIPYSSQSFRFQQRMKNLDLTIYERNAGVGMSQWFLVWSK